MIQVLGLSFTYPGAVHPAVHDLDFEVERGEVFGFLGPSGAGKSTTLGVLTGLLKGWAGEVRVDGRPLGDWGTDYYRRVGVSFELPNHYLKLTARENLDYFRALLGGAPGDVDRILARVDLQEDADRPVQEFSKGMKMRLNFARSLLHEPTLWFLDEPTTGLDPVNALRVRDLIRERQSDGTTTIVATHDMNTADAVCDRLAFIVDGRIAAIDTPTALRERFGTRHVEVGWRDANGEWSTESFDMDGLAENRLFLERLREPGLSSVHSQEASLEDVFVKVTGRVLR